MSSVMDVTHAVIGNVARRPGIWPQVTLGRWSRERLPGAYRLGRGLTCCRVGRGGPAG